LSEEKDSSTSSPSASCFFSHFLISAIAHRPKLITKNQLMKFITIAIVSGDNRKKFAIGLMSANQKAMKAYQIFHHPIGKTHELFARTLGINMYAWLASQAVG